MTVSEFLKGISYIDPDSVKQNRASPEGKLSLKGREVEAFILYGEEGNYSLQYVTDDGEKEWQIAKFELLSGSNQRKVKLKIEELGG